MASERTWIQKAVQQCIVLRATRHGPSLSEIARRQRQVHMRKAQSLSGHELGVLGGLWTSWVSAELRMRAGPEPGHRIEGMTVAAAGSQDLDQSSGATANAEMLRSPVFLEWFLSLGSWLQGVHCSRWRARARHAGRRCHWTEPARICSHLLATLALSLWIRSI